MMRKSLPYQGICRMNEVQLKRFSERIKIMEGNENNKLVKIQTGSQPILILLPDINVSLHVDEGKLLLKELRDILDELDLKGIK